MNGGERGIRTFGTFTRTTAFETAPFNHSGTSPDSGLIDSCKSCVSKRACRPLAGGGV